METSIHPIPTQFSSNSPEPKPYYKTTPEAPFALYLVDEEIFFPLIDQLKITIGRKTPGQGITPVIDLSPYDAYKKGVSLLHATIKFDDNKSEVLVVDLNSANGTRVNGDRIPPDTEVLIHNNDIITLGKLKVQVVIP